ncbi:MAG: methyltransferase domain-containing protein [Bacteroidota bacterium]
MNAPIIFFAYNRYESVERALQSLKANALAAESDLYIFSDGPKKNADEKAVQAIKRTREVLRSQQWCKKVFIEEAVENKGLANSVIDAVTKITEQFGRAIIVEDDALLSPFFLQYMNDALALYKDDEKVFGIGAWTYYMRNNKVNNTFFMRYPDSVTWGIFQRSWKHFIADASTVKQQLQEKGLMNKFNPFRNLHFFDSMLDNQINKKIDSWAIRWTATTVLHNGLILYPPVSMVRNMGNEEGTHEKGIDFNKDLPLATAPVEIKKIPLEENKTAFEEWKRFARIHFLNDTWETRIRLQASKITPHFIKKAARFLLNPGAKKTVPALTEHALMQTEPVSRQFGFDRGTPVDRYYIEKFLRTNSEYIKGNVLEIADSHYSKKFNSGVSSFEVLNFTPSPETTIVGDLTKPETLPEERIDCFICTQTLNFIYDVNSALKGSYQLLKPGGILLVTVAGICQISQFDNKQWGDFWRFTPLSLSRLAAEVFGEDNVQVTHYGNSLSAVLLLKGCAVEDTTTDLLDIYDEDYPVTITLRAVKRI